MQSRVRDCITEPLCTGLTKDKAVTKTESRQKRLKSRFIIRALKRNESWIRVFFTRAWKGNTRVSGVSVPTARTPDQKRLACPCEEVLTQQNRSQDRGEFRAFISYLDVGRRPETPCGLYTCWCDKYVDVFGLSKYDARMTSLTRPAHNAFSHETGTKWFVIPSESDYPGLQRFLGELRQNTGGGGFLVSAPPRSQHPAARIFCPSSPRARNLWNPG